MRDTRIAPRSSAISPLSEASQLYSLAPAVRARRIGSHVVLLDLRSDEYSAVGAPECDLLATFVHGWPRPTSPTSSDSLLAPTACNTAELIRRMLQAGMLIAEPSSSTTRGQEDLAFPRAALFDLYTDTAVHISIKDIIRFFIAIVSACALLRCRTMKQITDRIASRRVTQSAHIEYSSSRSTDHKMREIAGKFERLRALFYTSSDACLFDTLVLAEFLARYGYFPKLVFAVAIEPFRAHCWLQEGDTVLNGTLMSVLSFNPIASI